MKFSTKCKNFARGAVTGRFRGYLKMIELFKAEVLLHRFQISYNWKILPKITKQNQCRMNVLKTDTYERKYLRYYIKCAHSSLKLRRKHQRARKISPSLIFSLRQALHLTWFWYSFTDSIWQFVCIPSCLVRDLSSRAAKDERRTCKWNG